jgi:L-lactate dehydrogenase complex protein LldE
MATCLVNSFRPSIGFATASLIEEAGYSVHMPSDQTCCGQPGYNSGDMNGARDLAKKTIEAFEKYDYCVAPSGSCMGSVHTYPSLFNSDDPWHKRAQDFASKSYELTQFLCDVANFTPSHKYTENVIYHDACTGLRELKIHDQPRTLLKAQGATLVELEEGDVCCGFGGLFAIKYADISDRIVGQKTGFIKETKATTILGGDLGCLMNLAGKLQREGSDIKVRHIAEPLAGMLDTPALLEKPLPLKSEGR